MTSDVQAPDSEVLDAATWNVGWSRGRGCSQLAEALGSPVAVKDDWIQTCIKHKLDLLVTRRLPSFDLVPIAVPHDVELPAVRRVSAAIGEGPHSQLASQVAATLASTLGVPGELATVAHPNAPTGRPPERLAKMGAAFPELDLRVVHAQSATALVKDLPAQTLLVLGAPGGSWLQRQLFGPGHRLQVAAPGGSIVVRHAPRRCFHAAASPSGHVAGPHLSVADATHLFTGDIIPVAEAGLLTGIVRRSRLDSVPGASPIGDLMEPPVSVGAGESTKAVEEVRQFLDGGPIPVVDDSGRLIGVMKTEDDFDH